MSQPLVLVTGATGHIGFRVLALLLEKGYRTRVVSRKLSTAENLKELPSIAPYSSQVSFVEVPDFLAPDAFNDAVKDVDYIMHVASPIPDPDTQGQKIDVLGTYIEPAVQGNLGVLRAAAKAPSVKRIVITSSIAILDRKEGATSIGPDDIGKILPLSEVENTTNPWLAYHEAKRRANAAVEEFVDNENPHFDVVHILPAFVQGRNEPITTYDGLVNRVSSNTVLINYVLGAKNEEPRPTDLVLVDDVASTHVAALESKKVKNGERFIAAYPHQIKWSGFDDIVRRTFPRDVQDGILPLGGEQPEVSLGCDSSKTTEVLGVNFHGPEEMVKSLIGQLVELKRKELKK